MAIACDVQNGLNSDKTDSFMNHAEVPLCLFFSQLRPVRTHTNDRANRLFVAAYIFALRADTEATSFQS